jgi:hypothetical protein
VKINELINTLTGFEEIGIEKVCGYTLEELSDPGSERNPKMNREGMLVRAMGAVVIARRDKVPLAKAWALVQGMTRDECGDLFPDESEPEEPFEDEPITEPGKDGSVPATTPESSPPSSSTPDSANVTTSS